MWITFVVICSFHLGTASWWPLQLDSQPDVLAVAAEQVPTGGRRFGSVTRAPGQHICLPDLLAEHPGRMRAFTATW